MKEEIFVLSFIFNKIIPERNILHYPVKRYTGVAVRIRLKSQEPRSKTAK